MWSGILFKQMYKERSNIQERNGEKNDDDDTHTVYKQEIEQERAQECHP